MISQYYKLKMRKSKLFKAVLSFVLIFALLFSTGMYAFAEDPPEIPEEEEFYLNVDDLEEELSFEEQWELIHNGQTLGDGAGEYYWESEEAYEAFIAQYHPDPENENQYIDKGSDTR